MSHQCSLFDRSTAVNQILGTVQMFHFSVKMVTQNTTTHWFQVRIDRLQFLFGNARDKVLAMFRGKSRYIRETFAVVHSWFAESSASCLLDESVDELIGSYFFVLGQHLYNYILSLNYSSYKIVNQSQ